MVLEGRLSRREAGAFSLLSVPAQEIMLANVEAVRLLVAQGYSGVYASLSKDYLSVSSGLEEAGIDLGKIRFVDAVSRMYGIAPVETGDVVYVDGPLSMDALMEGIATSIRSLKGGKRFVLLDSLTIVLLYNSLDETVDFGKALRALLKKEHALGIAVIAHTGTANAEVIGRLSKGDDEVVTVGA